MKLLRTGVTCFLLLTFAASQLFAVPLPALLPPVPHPVFQYNNTQRTSENGVAHAGEFLKQGFQFVKDLFTGNFGQLGAGITQIGKYSMDGVKILFDPAGALVRQPLGFGQIVGRNLIAAAIAMPVSKGLEGLGVDSTMARLAGAFVSGGLAGLGGGLAGFINTGIQMYALQGVSELGMHLNLPPPLTQALSLAVNTALVDYFDPTFNLKANLPKIFPTFTQQMTLGGLDLLGRSLGINADIMKLISLPLSAAVGGVVGDVMKGNSVTNLWSTLVGGIGSAAIQIGLSFTGLTDSVFVTVTGP